MDVSNSMDSAALYDSTLKKAAGYDVFTRTTEKTKQMEENEQMRLQIAEQTGKGLNLDVTA